MNKSIIAVIVAIVVVVGVWMLYSGEEVKNTDIAPAGNDQSQDGIDHDGVMDGKAGMMKEVTVVGNNFSFAPAVIKVKKGDTVKVTFTNSGGFHDFKIDEFGVATKKINDGASEVVTFVADKAGSFEYYCSVGTHRQMGMKGTLIVE